MLGPQNILSMCKHHDLKKKNKKKETKKQQKIFQSKRIHLINGNCRHLFPIFRVEVTYRFHGTEHKCRSKIKFKAIAMKTNLHHPNFESELKDLIKLFIVPVKNDEHFERKIR